MKSRWAFIPAVIGVLLMAPASTLAASVMITNSGRDQPLVAITVSGDPGDLTGRGVIVLSGNPITVAITTGFELTDVNGDVVRVFLFGVVANSSIDELVGVGLGVVVEPDGSWFITIGDGPDDIFIFGVGKVRIRQ